MNSILDDQQPAYLATFSRETALLHTFMNTRKMLDRRSFVFTVALDLQAAFDTLNHEVLLHICEDRFGIKYTAIKWLQSYLLGRKQPVLVNDSVSKPAFLDSGVPQGSILGPMLFSVYLTPLSDLLKEIKVNYQLFADDTLLYFECSSKHIFNANFVELTIQKFLYWFANIGLQVNESKTEAILISSVKNAPSISSIKVGNVEVKLSNSLKCHGVTVEKHLDMDKQVKTVAKLLLLPPNTPFPSKFCWFRNTHSAG